MMSRLHLSLLSISLLLGGGANFASTQEPAPPATAPAAEDRSLTSAEAESLKFPSLDKPWKGADYQDAAQILSRIGTLDAAQLPRSGSARSGELFTRLTTTAHFPSFNDPAVNVKTRVPDALEQLQSLHRLGEIYFSAANRKLGGPKEYLEIYGVMTHAARRVLIALDEYVATLDVEKDPNAPFRKDGIGTLKQAIGNMVETVILAAGDDKLSADDRRPLVESIEAALPEALSRLPEDRRRQLVLRLKFIATNTESKELQPALQKLVEKVNKAMAAASP